MPRLTELSTILGEAAEPKRAAGMWTESTCLSLREKFLYYLPDLVFTGVTHSQLSSHFKRTPIHTLNFFQTAGVYPSLLCSPSSLRCSPGLNPLSRFLLRSFLSLPPCPAEMQAWPGCVHKWNTNRSGTVRGKTEVFCIYPTFLRSSARAPSMRITDLYKNRLVKQQEGGQRVRQSCSYPSLKAGIHSLILQLPLGTFTHAWEGVEDAVLQLEQVQEPL